MGRKLPWKRSKDEQSPAAKPVALWPPRVVVASSLSRLNASPSHGAHAAKRRRKLDDSDQLRSPSTSPPPERPKEEYMRPGLSADDRYRMVEDELLHIAQKFTAHLHRAEYDRLKAVAKSQNAAAIREIERPVVPGTALTQAAKRRQAELGKVKKQKDLGGGGVLPETGLRGLLESPRKETGRIRGYGGPAAQTRAAAGFQGRAGTVSPLLQSKGIKPLTAQRRQVSPSRHGQSAVASGAQEEAVESTSEEDNLGGPLIDRSLDRTNDPLPLPSHTALGARSQTHRSITTSQSLSRSSFQNDSSKAAITRKPGTSNQKAKDAAIDDFDHDDPFGIAKRQLQRAKSRQQLQKPSKPGPTRKTSRDTIPSFL